MLSIFDALSFKIQHVILAYVDVQILFGLRRVRKHNVRTNSVA